MLRAYYVFFSPENSTHNLNLIKYKRTSNLQYLMTHGVIPIQPPIRLWAAEMCCLATQELCVLQLRKESPFPL